MQAHVWADSSLQHFVKGASGMQVEVSESSACPWSKGQNENLLQLFLSHFYAVCVQPLVTREDYHPCVEVGLCEPHLVPAWEGGRTSFSHRDCVLGGLWKRLWRIPWLNDFYSHSSERKSWKSSFLYKQCLCWVLLSPNPHSILSSTREKQWLWWITLGRVNEKYYLPKINKKEKQWEIEGLY